MTPTEIRMLEALQDGEPHSIDELAACLPNNEDWEEETVHVHISNLRKHLRQHDQDIVRVRVNKIVKYMHVVRLCFLTKLRARLGEFVV